MITEYTTVKIIAMKFDKISCQILLNLAVAGKSRDDG